jgi:hypothetical protein
VVYMLIHCIDESIERTPEIQEEFRRLLALWHEDVSETGVKLAGSRLDPVRTATTVRVRAGEVLAVDGPFAETKEQIAGYDLIECAGLAQAVDVAARHPTTRIGSIEIRPLRHA